MKTITKWLSLFTLFVGLNYVSTAQTPTPLVANGRLKVINRQLCNESGKPIQLRGMSTHGLQWYGGCYSLASTQVLATQWGCDVLRAAMYVDEGGYLTNKIGIKAKLEQIVDWTEQTGMYCIVDWHMLTPGDPNLHTADAIEFFTQQAQRNAGKKHVIYEICNEPNGATTWADIKRYADQIIPVIRQYDAEALILVGTPTWSSLPTAILSDPLTGANAYNIMYTFHFYAASDFNQAYLNTALQTVPIFVSEWGVSRFTGDNGNNYINSQQWVDLLAGANTAGVKVSWCNWSFCDKAETSAALNPFSCQTGNWNNTSPSGTWVKQHLLIPSDSWTVVNLPPTVSLTTPVNNSQWVTGTPIEITANAADGDGLIRKVDFYVGASLIKSVTAAPYAFTWANAPAGAYSLTAKATDNSNAIATSTAVIIRVAANRNPTVVLTSPAYGSSYSPTTPITLTATANDLDGTISKVDFYAGTTLIQSVVSPPYTFTWENVPVGTYNITAKATDNLNAIATSAVSLIRVSIPNQNPIVTMTTPTHQATYLTNTPIPLTATASDPDGSIRSVSFYQGNVLLKTIFVPPYTFAWSTNVAGTYLLTAKAIDNQNALTTSQPIQIMVEKPIDILGANCVTANTPTVFELTAANQVNANRYVWSCVPATATQSITPVVGQPWKANFNFKVGVTSANVCVLTYYTPIGYKYFCKTVTRCLSKEDAAINGDIPYSISPNPTFSQFTFTSQKPLDGLRLWDYLGIERLYLKRIEAGQTIHFGENLPIGIYFLEINAPNAPLKVVKMVKSM
jgi:Cellulase (glycosyl hydrolase family 5)/Bacterial Ig domain